MTACRGGFVFRTIFAILRTVVALTGAFAASFRREFSPLLLFFARALCYLANLPHACDFLPKVGLVICLSAKISIGRTSAFEVRRRPFKRDNAYPGSDFAKLSGRYATNGTAIRLEIFP